ncbi:pseudaminic acid cytidylyltransferase [Stappia sp.]|uniref:pseudaminic acid cytidylyltransferase n=1 Tax=Stappia sp. TaxID=1870903 RepID=UPI0032D97299
MTVAIIPARGGSKRIPDKNIIDMMGRPMLSWPITSALESSVFTRVLVSTDSERIADAAVAAGAEVPGLRPAEISDDLSTLDAVIRHAITAYDIADEWVCVIYATAVLLRPETLARAHDAALSAPAGADFVMSLLPFPHPIQRAVALEEGQVRMLDQRNTRIRTQDLEMRYHDAAQFVFGRRDAWLAGRTVWDSTTRGIVLTPDEAVDIDTPDSLNMVEALLRHRLSPNES